MSDTAWTDKRDPLLLADECYPDAHYGPDHNRSMDLTHEQKTSLFRKWKQMAQDRGLDAHPTWPEFAKTVQPTFGMDGAVVVQWCGMWLAIETDGYTHS